MINNGGLLVGRENERKLLMMQTNITNGYKIRKVVSRQPISIVNLKSNTMKNTMQI